MSLVSSLVSNGFSVFGLPFAKNNDFIIFSSAVQQFHRVCSTVYCYELPNISFSSCMEDFVICLLVETLSLRLAMGLIYLCEPIS